MDQGKVKLIIADDHNVLRQGLCEMLEDKGHFSVVGQAADGIELLKVLKENPADIILMDISMPNLDGIATLDRMNAQNIHTPVVMLSANEGERNVRMALKAGAKGYLPKNVSLDELEFAINSVMQGKTYLSPTITSSLMNAADPTQSPISVLTKREVEILKYLAQGKPNKDIGKLLHISSRTVDTHRSNILKKLNLRTNAELVKLAISEDLIAV
jgi:DNA-binding NarL/FixJ family response regulator